MKKPNPHFMDRKVTYKRHEKKSDKPENKQDKDEDKPTQKLSRKKNDKQVTAQLGVAQHSTKSMGKFDRKAHQEERKLKVKRRKDHANFSSLDQQIQRNMEVLSMVKRAEGSKKVSHSM